MYGPSPDCKQDLLIVEAVCSYVYGFLVKRWICSSHDGIRAPSLLNTRRPQLQTVNPIRIRVGRLDLFSQQSIYLQTW